MLSEGEQKIAAIAGFFALLDVSPNRSTVVFDDPVTSLDHNWRGATANRIVEEAKKRPVIVFTHDPRFCCFLGERADEHAVPIEYRTVVRRGGKAGIVNARLN